MRSILLPLLLVLSSICVYGQKTPLLKVSADKRYLETQTGKPFFWLGDTAWELLHRLNREEADLYLRDREGKGFTVIQTVVLAELDGLKTPNAYGHLPLLNQDPTQLNEKYFDHVDYVVNKAEKLGLYIGLLPTWGDKFNKAWGVGPEIFTPENARQFGEILAKRYAKQNNIIWILGGDRWPENEEDRQIIRAMAQGIRSVGTKHLITYHPSGAKKATDHFNEDWLDLDMFQSGHERLSHDFKFIRSSRAVTPTRPVINGEPRYEDHPDRFKPEEFGWMDASDVRSSAYWTMLSGAAGYTYGAHGIWQMYQANRSPISWARTSWQASLDLPGATHLMLLKKLFTAFPWQQLRNDQSLILNNNPEGEAHQVAAIGEQKDFLLAYTPMGKELKLDLSKLPANKLEAYWFNPRDGQCKKIGEFNRTDQPTFTPWSVGRGSDFVLILLPVNSPYKLPW
ncbi:glycoside hydrolase family 140 protein [Rufibacter tibetensis]|uniref:Endoglucanase n=1 Tax=Rufibacter tibetensis TaxID=512763 RepID=A0A0P0CTX0_9BACT|nr:glycoside hydrolase family 140 protein [Rufibacter tibetensis]ALI98692.1 endoglucanase [Rufibacter tibetensis]